MPRPIKEGLDYFPLDVDLDDKIYMVECELGLTGFALLIKLFIKIYKNGYYINWNEKIAKMFARQNNTEIDVVNRLLDVCINEEIVSKTLYEKYNILTSRGIQKRYLEAVKRRKEITLIKEYMLMKNVEKSINVNINWIDVNNNSINDDDNTQSKVKKSKVKKSKEDIKESKALSFKKPKKGKEPLEFSFLDKCWYGLDDWRIKMFQGKFPMLTINYLLEDKFKTKFLSDPIRYKAEIKKAGGIENLVWAWLGQEKKFYLQDHPEYAQSIGRNITHIKNVIENLKIIKDRGG